MAASTPPSTLPPGTIAWLASYPRSGSTWVRFLLTAYRHGAIGRSTDVAREVPDIHGPDAVRADIAARLDRGAPLIVKTHVPWTAHHPFAARTARAVLLVRHPRDVLLSSLAFHRALGHPTPPDDAEAARAFIAESGDPAWRAAGFGTWSRHAQSWLDVRAYPVHVLRYEDLRADPAHALTGLLRFLGEPVSAERVARAVHMCTFDAMLALEIREKSAQVAHAPDDSGDNDHADQHDFGVFVGPPHGVRTGALFMDRGRLGTSLDALSPGLDQALRERFRGELDRLGYG
ncbi:MAG: sulfotransferase domain-containing protein [Phycisphaeraceae bacterium]|nr:sulfotransferase domain-containing protein [Phycisphaeraceae bacterium]